MHRRIICFLLNQSRQSNRRCLTISVPLSRHQPSLRKSKEFPRQAVEIRPKKVTPILQLAPENKMDETTEVEVIRTIVQRLKASGQEIILLDPIESLYRRTPVHTAPEILSSTEALVEFFVLNSDFFLMNRTYWDNFIAVFADFGFSPREIVALLRHFGSNRVSNPSAPQILLDLFQAFNDAFVKGETLRGILLAYPALFDLSPGVVRVFTSQLKTLLSTEQIIFTYKNHPEIFLQTGDFDGLSAKFAYLTEEMMLKANEIMKCCWFALPLQEIRLRHEFLVRTGAYMTPNPKKPLLSKDNPQLKEILESSDKDFATRVGGVSPQEFQVFREMFSRQLADEQSELLRESADAYEKC